MTSKKSPGADGTPMPGEAGIDRVYRSASKEMPSVSVDAKILAEAQKAITKQKTRSPSGIHWEYPLSSAAVIVLSLGVALLLNQQGVFNRQSPPSPPTDTATAPGIARDVPLTPTTPAAEEPARSKGKFSAKTETVQPELSPTLAAKQPPASPAASMEAKKSEREVSALSGPSMASGSIAEERPAGLVSEVARARENMATKDIKPGLQADGISVQVSGEPGTYQFTVGIRSPDTGCQQYADWWEVVSGDGKLLYRRVLLHSHVEEQPFTRSGGPVPIQSESMVWVRAHMNTSGYGGKAFKGSIKSGFTETDPGKDFAANLAYQPPLPNGCDF